MTDARSRGRLRVLAHVAFLWFAVCAGVGGLFARVEHPDELDVEIVTDVLVGLAATGCILFAGSRPMNRRQRRTRWILSLVVRVFISSTLVFWTFLKMELRHRADPHRQTSAVPNIQQTDQSPWTSRQESPFSRRLFASTDSLMRSISARAFSIRARDPSSFGSRSGSFTRHVILPLNGGSGKAPGSQSV